MLNHILQDAVTLFVVIDPIGLVPLFIAMTREESAASRRQIASLGVVLATIILVAFIAVGQFLLSALEIGLDAFRIAGGIVLLIIGLQMVLTRQYDGENGDSSLESASDRAVFPLAIPFIAGPGTIMTVVLLTDNQRFSVTEQLETGGSLLIVLLITYVFLLTAESIQKLLRKTGVKLVTRVLGLLLAALAMQTILNGIRGFFWGVGSGLMV
jgi:multiple antibiotic resistance protein